MAIEYTAELARQLQTHLVGRNEMLAWLRAVHEDFHGDSINTQWAVAVAGSGINPAVQANSPSRILMDTGGSTNGSSELSEGGFLHWSLADRLTVVVRSLLSATTTVQHRPILLQTDASNYVLVQYDTGAGDTGWRLTTASGGVTTVSAAMKLADTNWHQFIVTLQPGSVKARVDNESIFESTTNLPAGSMQFRTNILTRDNVSRTSQVDYITLIPGLALW